MGAAADVRERGRAAARPDALMLTPPLDWRETDDGVRRRRRVVKVPLDVRHLALVLKSP